MPSSRTPLDVACLLGGVADPKWPVRALPVSADMSRLDDDAYPRILSPFDEAALELALKLRDSGAAHRITVWLIGGAQSDALARTLAAHKPDALQRIERAPLAVWDATRFARQLAGVVDGLDRSPDLLLVGREMGDSDDGSFPAYLAHVLGRRFFGLAQYARCGDAIELVRERGALEESVMVDSPMLASVTTDRRNRLRHPLLKNLMLTRRNPVPVVVPPAASGARRVTLVGAEPTRPAARASHCTMLEGALPQQAQALARRLGRWRRSP